MSVVEYISMRRDTSAMMMAFVIGEFAMGIELPSGVSDHPLVKTMETCASDLVWLINDVYSWNVEQSEGQTANMVTVLMNRNGMTIQEAVDFVAVEVSQRFKLYLESKSRLPASWLSDNHVRAYLTNLEDWVVGYITWSFESPRYFGGGVEEIRKTLTVTVIEPRSGQKSARGA